MKKKSEPLFTQFCWFVVKHGAKRSAVKLSAKCGVQSKMTTLHPALCADLKPFRFRFMANYEPNQKICIKEQSGQKGY